MKHIARRQASAGAAVACALLLAACGASGPAATTRATVAATAPTATSPAPAPTSLVPGSPAPSLASPVTGVVIAVDSAGLAKVSGFTLRLPDGSQRAFRIGVLENGDRFPPGHLSEHLASASPVRVYFRPEGADLVVYRIEDAG